MICKPVGTEVPTGYNGIGIGKEGNVAGYWFIEETPIQDGYFVGHDNVRIGSFNYTDGMNQLAGTWMNDDGSSRGTWYATAEDPTTFIDSTPEPPVSGENEACDYWDEASWSYVQCTEGLICAPSEATGEYICTIAPEQSYAGIDEACGYDESA